MCERMCAIAFASSAAGPYTIEELASEARVGKPLVGGTCRGDRFQPTIMAESAFCGWAGGWSSAQLPATLQSYTFPQHVVSCEDCFRLRCRCICDGNGSLLFFGDGCSRVLAGYSPGAPCTWRIFAGLGAEFALVLLCSHLGPAIPLNSLQTMCGAPWCITLGRSAAQHPRRLGP